MDAEDVSSGLHVWTASTLWNELSPQSLTFTLDALVMWTNQTGVFILRVMNDVIKRHLLEEFQVWPGVSELEVMPIRFLREAYGIGRKTDAWEARCEDVLFNCPRMVRGAESSFIYGFLGILPYLESCWHSRTSEWLNQNEVMHWDMSPPKWTAFTLRPCILASNPPESWVLIPELMLSSSNTYFMHSPNSLSLWCLCRFLPYSIIYVTPAIVTQLLSLHTREYCRGQWRSQHESHLILASSLLH